MRYSSANASEIDINKKKEILKKVERIVFSNNNESEIAIQLRRLFPKSSDFKSKYFYLTKNPSSYFYTKVDLINYIYELICKYEKNGIYEDAKKADIFKLKQTGYKVDAREIIKAYNDDKDSYLTRDFYKKHNITRDIFNSCVACVRKNDKEEYDRYEKTKQLNQTKEIIMPMYYFSEIYEGIKTGSKSNGEPFDIFEFWRLNPFKTEDIEMEIKRLIKKHDFFRKISYLNQRICNEEHRIATYRDYVCNFVEILGFDKDHTIKNYMEENNIKSCVLLNRDRIINNYQLYQFENITKEDMIEIIDYMELENIPLVKDAFVRLVSEYAKQKNYSKDTRKELSMKLIREE